MVISRLIETPFPRHDTSRTMSVNEKSTMNTKN